jgi:Zn-dependent protease
MDNVLLIIFQLVVLLFSVIIHEISHGYMAERLGDPTARLQGRLTLNPLQHLDPFGSFLLPLALYIASGGAFVFGWAKPVPFNPLLLKNPKNDSGKIAIAGPVSNLALAFIFGIALRIALASGYASSPFLGFLDLVVVVNVTLAIFNLVPLPPLDGSKVLYALLPSRPGTYSLVSFLERYGFILLLAFIFFGFNIIRPIIQFVYSLITGQMFGI